MSSEPPEEPHQRSEPNTLSPASPKPIHFPTPAHIPVLQKQMDVGFNQTEAHMNDPAMHNTEIRPDFWVDPAEQPAQQQQQQQPSDNPQPMQNMVGDVDMLAPAGDEEKKHEESLLQQQNGYSNSDQTASPESAFKSGTLSSFVAPQGATDSAASVFAHTQPSDTLPSTADPNPADAVSAQPGDESAIEPSSATQYGAVDVQALLDNLHAAPAPDSMAVTAAVPSSILTSTQLQPNATVATPDSQPNLAPSSSNLLPQTSPQEQSFAELSATLSLQDDGSQPHSIHTQSVPDGGQANAGETSVQVAGKTEQESFTAAQQQQANVVSEHPGVSNAATDMPANPTGDAHDAATTAIPPTVPNPSSSTAHAAFTNLPDAQAVRTPSQDVTATEGKRENAGTTGGYVKPEDRPWTSETQRKYDRFLDDERRYVNEGRWEQFPQGSRLFVGNLSSERVTKRDIFHVFHVYGELAQISIKQAYGFVQFLRSEDCNKALEWEQGTPIRDKRIHLEVSKPQKSRGSKRARSRSPEHGRSRVSPSVDRYVSDSRVSNARSRRGGGGGGRNRSPSPRGPRDRYDDRYRVRSRSPEYGRGSRYRSPSPRRDVDEDLPLPRRDPRDVPDVQIIVLEQLDRDFIAWVENAFSSRGVRVDVLLLSPRLSEEVVIRRQIVEGVLAVSKLTRHNQIASKVGLQLFDRRGGNNNVKFEEYDNLDPSICAELVLRAKYNPPSHAASTYQSTQQNYMYSQQQQPGGQMGWVPPQQQPQAPASAYNQQHSPQNLMSQATAAVPPHLQSLITNLDSNGLQNLLSAMNTPQSGGGSGGPGPNPFAASMQQNTPMSAVQNPQQQFGGYLRPQVPQQQQHQQHQHAPMQQQQMPPAPGQQVNMQEILARLGTYKQ